MKLAAAKPNIKNEKKKQSGIVRKARTLDLEKELYWRQVFQRFHLSGLPFRKFCEQEKISANTFQYWRRELQRRDKVLGVKSTVKRGDNRPSNTQERITFWLGVINEINSYSGSVRSFCTSRGIASGTLHCWEKKLKSMNLTAGSTDFSANCR